jgi:ATP-dependent DNA ligase
MDSVKKLTLYHDASKGGLKQWSIWIEKDKTTVTVEWGLAGCKLQTSSDSAKPKGVEGTKSYKDEKQCAQENYDRQIKKKRDEGYREDGEKADTQDWLNDLDKNFVPAKPRNDMDEAAISAKDASNELLIQRKRDGQRHLALITKKGEVKLYSRRLEPMTANFPLLCKRLKDMGLPKGTILDGEIIVDRDGRDDFRAVSTMTKAKPEKSAAREKELGSAVRYMVFDCLYFASKPLWERSYLYRYEEVLLNYIPAKGPVFYAKDLELSFATLSKQAKREKWEGLVCWFRNEPTVLRTGGKPKRAGCAKWKPIKEGDFIATGYELGSGEQSGLVGAIYLAEYDPDTDELREAGKCGTGFGLGTRKAALKWKYPLVVKIEYDKQEPTGKLRFPVFMEVHEDKTPNECVGVDLTELE